MRVWWALAAVVCGVIGVRWLGFFVQGRSPLAASSAVSLLFGLSMLYAAWRSAVRVRASSTTSATSETSKANRFGVSLRRLAAALAAAIIVMSVSFAVGLYLADSGEWGGEDGPLYRVVMLAGHGVRIVALRIGLGGGDRVAYLLQCALLAAFFYVIGGWWAKKRAGVFEAARRRWSSDTRRRTNAALAAAGAVLVLAGIATIVAYSALRGRNLISSDEGVEGVEAFQIGRTRGKPIWRIEAPPGRVLERLKYGEVPEGFRQTVPVSGRPRLLHKGEKLVTQVLTPKRVYEHYGQAPGGRRFVSGISMSGPRKFPDGLSQDQLRRAIDVLFPVGTRMVKVREEMEHQGFACEDVKDGDWDDRSDVNFLACRRSVLGTEEERITEVAFFRTNGIVGEFLLRESTRERSTE